MRFNSKSARSACLGAGTLVLAMLASCGGSTQVERYVPKRLIVLGDETSVLNTDGSKYSINSTVSVTDLTLDCSTRPLWVQVLANVYGLVFAQCNPAGLAVTGLMFATPAAKVADIASQAGQMGPLTSSDLVTVLAGANDVLAQYARYPGVSEQQLAAELEMTGTALAAQVNAIAEAGGKVLIATVPDLGLSPFAIAQKAANTDTDRAALLSRLTFRLNAKLRANIINDGRRIGLLLADELIQTDVKFPATYGYVNVIAAACLSSAVLPACTTNTLQPATTDVAAASASTWLWADATHLSSGGHNQLGALAATRTAGNPF